MKQPAVDGRGDGSGKAPPGPREDRSCSDVASDWDPQGLLEIPGRETEAARARDAEGAPDRRTGRDDVAGTDQVADLRSRGHPDGQGVIRAPRLAPPGHEAVPGAAVACTAASQREIAGMRSPSRSGRESGRPRASTSAPSMPDRP